MKRIILLCSLCVACLGLQAPPSNRRRASYSRLHLAQDIRWLAEDFDRLQVTHETVRELRREIPLLLYIPYTDEIAERIFTLEAQLLFGKEGEVLASSRDEMVSLQNALVLAVQGPLRATNLISRQNLTAPIIECRFVVQDDHATEVSVEWNVNGALASANFSGLSELQLEGGKVNVHRLKKFKLNGQEQDATTVANALSRIRQTVRSFQQAQSFQATLLPFGPMLTQYRNDFIKQLDITLPKNVTSTLAYAISQSNVSLDRPLPGTELWETYARSHALIHRFVEETVPRLALAPSDAPFDMTDLFVPDAKMIGLDGTTLLATGRRLAKYYQSLASWRKRALTTWTLSEAAAVSWKDKIEVRISYTIDLPGSESTLCGVDRYTFKDDESKILIESVHQESLSIGGNSKQQDLVLFMRGLVTAVENDRFAYADETWMMDLWQRLRTSKSADNSPVVKAKKTKIRSDAASATIYRIMMALHDEGRALVDSSLMQNQPPALDFMIENVQLRGLINESLLRGKAAYQQNLGLSIASLRGSLRSGSVSCEKEPSTKVELTPAGNIRYSLALYLKLEPFAGLSNLMKIPSAGLPLQIDLISDYILDPDSGRIVQHRLIESRINGSLTPGDLLSRVVLRRQDGIAVDDGALSRTVTDFVARLVSRSN